MLSVDEAVQNLSERFLATMPSETSVQDAVFRVRLNEVALKRELADIHSRTRVLVEQAQAALRSLLQYLHRDTAFMAFADALVSVGVATLADVKQHSEVIKARAREAAGFDVMGHLSVEAGRVSAAPTAQLENFDVVSFRNLMSETIRGRLQRTQFDQVLAIAREIGELQLCHDLRTSFERLDALTLRVSAEWEPRLREAAQLYMEGKLEIPQVARLVGASSADIAAEFERLGFVRHLATIRLSEAERLQRAEQAMRPSSRDARDGVVREVVASQRIEGIDARRHLDEP